MKKLFLLLSAFLFISLVGCVSYASKEDFAGMVSVNSVPDKKDAIYDKIMKWIAVKYNSPKKVMQYCDKPSGLITFNGAGIFKEAMNPMYHYVVEYKSVINIKDGKYKFEMTPVSWVYSARGQVGTDFSMEMAKWLNQEYKRVDADLLEYIKSGNNNNW